MTTHNVVESVAVVISVAIGDVVRGMGDLQYNAGASMKDLIFLRSLLENPVMHRIVRTHDSLDPNQHAQGSSHDAHYNMPDHDHYVQPPRSFRPVPVDGNLSGLSKSVAEDLERLGKYYKEASYLQRVLSSFEFIVSRQKWLSCVICDLIGLQ